VCVPFKDFLIVHFCLMSCTAITEVVTRESGRFIANEIYTRHFADTPIIRLVQRGVVPEGMGDSWSVLTYERSAPTEVEPTWHNVLSSESDGAEGGMCLAPATKVGIASTTRSFNMQRIFLEGPDFCAESMRGPFELQQQLNAIVDILGEYSRLEWEIRYRHNYFRMVKRKVVATLSGPVESNTGALTYPATCPSSILTQGLLDIYAAKLRRDGARQSAMVTDNGSAVLTLLTSWETANSLIFNNADIRQDLRYGQPNELLKPFLTDRRIYRGFVHLIDDYPRRFTCAGGVYTEVPAFYTTAATKGVKAEINPSYETAPYEETVIFDPTVYKSLIPRPIGTVANKFPFNPVNYTGVWKVMNIPDRVCNPDGNIIYHRGILAEAPMPVHPERGVAFVHLRCDPAIAATACVS